jgi:hypothetical protein
MNLWARLLRQLTVLAVALFFFSCEDETSILGFKNPKEKFKVNFVDIPLQSSLLLLDSLRTSNFQSQTELNRLLVGKYYDDKFGEVKATGITQFFTTNTAKTLLQETAVFDSVSIQLRFDFYTYGSFSSGPQTISVHELQRELKFDSLSYYFNKSNTPYNSSPLGTETFSITPDFFNTYLEDKKDTTITIHFPLDAAFGQRIFDSALRYRNASTTQDSTFVKLREFVKEFNGIAIVANEGDKIVGFNPAATASRITLHYHDADTDSLQLNLSFSGMISYNEIDGDRSSTELAGLTQYSEPFLPDNNLRYIQSGTGVLTRLDFQNFHDFVDADSNSSMIVNSAELYLGPPQSTAVYPPIDVLSLRGVKGEGYIRKIADPAINRAQYLADSTSVTLYAGQLGISNGMFSPMAADGSVFTISKSGTNDYYSGFLTLFAQQVFKKEEGKERFRYFVLYPEAPPIGKSVNRVIFEEENIKLRIFYTRPSEPVQ